MEPTRNGLGALFERSGSALRLWWSDLTETQGCTCSPHQVPLPSGVVVAQCELHAEAERPVQPPWI